MAGMQNTNDRQRRPMRRASSAMFACAALAALATPVVAAAQTGQPAQVPQGRPFNLDQMRATDEPRCNAGNYNACFGLGWAFYLWGRTPQEEAQGVTWMRRACAGGNVPACRMMPR